MNGADNNLWRSFEASAVAEESKPDQPSVLPAASDSEATPSEPTGAVVVREVGGPAGPEPTRYGDWERKGRCIDF